MASIRIGIVGKRGASAIAGFRAVPGVEVAALCEIDERTLQAQLSQHGIDRGFTRFDEMLDHVDAVVIGTPMNLHVPQAVQALNAGKHVLGEVTAAVSLEECWRLLDAVQSSGKAYMMAENYCYLPENILVRHLVRDGVFGKIYFAEGEYIHEVRALHHNPDGSPTWRYFWQVGVPGNTYITHEIGPPMQWFREQSPDVRIESVTCLGTGVRTDPEHPHDDTTLTLAKLSDGSLLKLRLDMMSNRPEMTFYSLQGTLGAYESGRGGATESRIYVGPNEPEPGGRCRRRWRPLDDFWDALPADWRAHLEAGRQAGHGGGDYQVARLFAESIRDDAPLDIDVYASLEWTAAGLCSQISIADGGVPVRVPDFRNPAERPATLDSPPTNPTQGP
ncbi:MAG: Gfo/Idh/MocA family oxidoreductase [Fimbriimonadaceae bacterium]